MSKRIYNEKGICNLADQDVKDFSNLMVRLSAESSQFAVEHSLDLRDALSYAEGLLHSSFAGAILRSWTAEREANEKTV